MIYDVCIIGGGISGLYCAYKLKQNGFKSVLVIEKNNYDDYNAGRLNNYLFHDNLVSTGATIGRKDKDYLLIKLLNELNVNYKDVDIKYNYSKTISNFLNIYEIIDNLKILLEKSVKKDYSVKDFFLKHYTKETYDNFLILTGFTDYYNSDITEFLYNYGIEDNITNWKGLKIIWRDLVKKLILNLNNIVENEEIKSINYTNSNTYELESEKYIYKCKNVVIATTINHIKKLVNFDFLKYVESQPFLKVFAKSSDKSSNIIKQYVDGIMIVPTILHKIIHINDGVYMIAYNDNNNSILLKDKVDDYIYLANLVKESLGIKENLEILDVKSFYWEEGTHYYKPLNNRETFFDNLQNPCDGLYIIGESVSNNQGWVEGALESVENILKL